MSTLAESKVAARHGRIASILAILLGALAIGAEPVSAFSFDETIQRCRQTVGRPIVSVCIAGRRFNTRDERMAAVAACRTRASPRVRACVQRSMIAAYGWPKVESAIEQCRQSIGRPAVNACMTRQTTGQHTIPDLEACRNRAAPRVRACVRRTLTAAG